MPVGVGFGIRDAASAQAIAAHADAVVIGSRLVQEIEAGPPEDAASRAGAWLATIRGALDAMARKHAAWSRMERETERSDDELAAEAPAAADQAHAGRHEARRCPRDSGSSVARAKRCSTAPTSRRTSTSARSAATTRAFGARERIDQLLDRRRPLRDRLRSACRSTASSSRTAEVSRAAVGGARGHRRDRRARRDAGQHQERAAWWWPRSSSTSWAARWARSSASASCAACASRTRTACRSSASPRRAARACRKA